MTASVPSSAEIKDISNSSMVKLSMALVRKLSALIDGYDPGEDNDIRNEEQARLQRAAIDDLLTELDLAQGAVAEKDHPVYVILKITEVDEGED